LGFLIVWVNLNLLKIDSRSFSNDSGIVFSNSKLGSWSESEELLLIWGKGLDAFRVRGPELLRLNDIYVLTV